MCFFVPRTSIQSPPSASTSRTRLVGSISLRCWSITIPDRVFARSTVPWSGCSSPVRSLSNVVLPAPFGADDADAISALDSQREVTNDVPIAIALRNLVRVDHRLRSYVVLGNGKLRGARTADHRRALRSHFVKLGEPSLVAAASSSDASLQPAKLERQLGIELVRRASFFLVGLFHPGLETAESDLRAPQVTAIEPQAALRQPGQECPVVTDDDECARVAVQPILQPLDAGEIEVVGRLVEEEHVGVLRQCSSDRRAAAFAPAGGRDGPRQVELDLVGNGRGLVGFWRVGSGAAPSRAKSSDCPCPDPAQAERPCFPERSFSAPHRSRSVPRGTSAASSCPHRCGRSAPAGRAGGCARRDGGTASLRPEPAQGLRKKVSPQPFAAR